MFDLNPFSESQSPTSPLITHHPNLHHPNIHCPKLPLPQTFTTPNSIIPTSTPKLPLSQPPPPQPHHPNLHHPNVTTPAFTTPAFTDPISPPWTSIPPHGIVIFERARSFHSYFMFLLYSWIYNRLPVSKQMLALSATYPEALAKSLTTYMRDPTFVRLNPRHLALKGTV